MSIDRVTPKKLDIHCIADNYATNEKSRKSKAGLTNSRFLTSALFRHRHRA
jgi:hypothetical protein